MWSKPKIKLPYFKTYSRDEIVGRVFEIALALKEIRLTNSFWPRKNYAFNSFPLCRAGHQKACPKENDDEELTVPKEFYKIPFLPFGFQTSSQFANVVMDKVQKADGSIADLATSLESIHPGWKAPIWEQDPHKVLYMPGFTKALVSVVLADAFDHLVNIPMISLTEPTIYGSAFYLIATYSALGNHRVSRENMVDPNFTPTIRPRLRTYWYTSNAIRGMLLSMMAAMAMAVPQVVDLAHKIPQEIEAMYADLVKMAANIEPEKMADDMVTSIPQHARDMHTRYTLEIKELEEQIKNEPHNEELKLRLRVKKMHLQDILDQHGEDLKQK